MRNNGDAIIAPYYLSYIGQTFGVIDQSFTQNGTKNFARHQWNADAKVFFDRYIKLLYV